MRFGVFWDRWGIASVVVVLLVVAVILQPDFLAVTNVQKILRESAYLGIVAAAMTVAVMNGTFDLSVGGQLALVSVVTLLAYGIGGSGLAIVAALAAGLACGAVNGALITALRVPPFVATLGMLFVFRGVADLLTQDEPAKLAYTEIGSVFAQIGSSIWVGIPVPFLLMAAVFGATFVLLHRTGTGRRIIGYGSSPQAARFSGISATRIRFLVFVLVGLSVGIAALTYVSRVWTADGGAQDGFELRVITAVVLGGASLSGGKGSLIGTFSSVLLVAILNGLLQKLEVDSSYQKVILGCVLIVALAVDGLRTKFAGLSSLRRVPALRIPRTTP